MPWATLSTLSAILLVIAACRRGVRLLKIMSSRTQPQSDVQFVSIGGLIPRRKQGACAVPGWKSGQRGCAPQDEFWPEDDALFLCI